jgi:hypothetical protein
MRTITEAVLTLIGIRKFTETFARFEEADKHKTEFLCRMSHELRYYAPYEIHLSFCSKRTEFKLTRVTDTHALFRIELRYQASSERLTFSNSHH